MLIIRDMLFAHKKSYGDFMASDEKIATNILANRLATLEDRGFVRKFRDPANKTKYIYVLTDMTIDLIPLFIEIILWSEKHATVPIPEERLDDLKKAKADKAAFAREVHARVVAQTAALAKQQV